MCAQDIQELHIAQIEENKLIKEVNINVSPEEYLQHFANTLTKWGLAPKDIKELIVVTGPGSFTASRVSVTIANTLAFSQGVMLRGVENKEHLALAELWEKRKNSLPDSSSVLLPSYDREATITKPKT